MSLSEFLKSSQADVVIVGAGLAGSECAWQLLNFGYRVALIEQRPSIQTPAHKTANFAELVCSNSLKSNDPTSAPGVLKKELEAMNSLILKCAYENQIPAGQSLAVDRNLFSEKITKTLKENKNLEFYEASIDHFEEVFCGLNSKGQSRPVVFATGPLTGEKLAASFKDLIGSQLYFYDAIAPIIAGDSINKEICFKQNRYDKGNEASHEDGDYYNCPMNEAEYKQFIEALGSAEKVQPHDFEKAIYFQGCQPIEALLERGPMTLAFGPMKPKGLTDPRTGKSPFACVQLRSEDQEGRAWNLVGFQTKLKYPDQSKVFRLIPGLENAEFYRYGSLHRNTFIHSPLLLDHEFRLKKNPLIYFAGQITGAEGYLESTALGAYVARMIILRLKGLPQTPVLSSGTALGALTTALYNGKVKNFQPLNMNWGLVPLNGIAENDKEKKAKLVARAERQFKLWMDYFA